jgi:methanogenic corrinoid protein MtbC1
MQEVLGSELPAPVAQSATGHVEEAINRLGAGSESPDSPLTPDDDLHRLALQYLEALLAGDRERAEKTIFAAVDDGLELRSLYEGVLQPAQVELGRLWHAGEIGVTHEHFASAVTQAIMSTLRFRFPERNGKGKLVIAAAVGGELHEIGVRMVADFFEMDGWEVVCLGANTPSADIVELVRERQPHLLALSASTLMHVRTVGELIENLRQDDGCAKTRVLVGGPPFRSVPDLWSELGADGGATSATEAVQLGNSLVSDSS